MQQTTYPTGDKLANYLTMLGHICSDINQGALSAILPFLVVGAGYSYFQATMLVFCANVASAVIQPLFGWLGDRRATPQFMAAGVFFAGLGMALIGWAPSYALVLVAALVSGVGVAMFHPEGGRLANLAAGSHKSEGMSVFAVGGNIGFFVGPILCSIFVGSFGLHGTLVFLVPTTICAAILLLQNPRFVALGRSKTAHDATNEPEDWPSFALAMLILSLRSILSYGFMAFIPLFLVAHLGQTEVVSATAISLFAIVGAAATLASGKISARTGTIPLMLACLVAAALGSIAFTYNQSLAAAFLLIALLAISVDMFYPSSVALAMSFVPAHLGMASGMTYGVAVAVGGALDPALGIAGDTFGLTWVMFVLAVLAALGVVLTLALSQRISHSSY